MTPDPRPSDEAAPDGGQQAVCRPMFLIGFAADEATATAEAAEYGYFTVTTTPDRDHPRPIYAEPPAASSVGSPEPPRGG